MTAVAPFPLLHLAVTESDDATSLRHLVREAATGLGHSATDATRIATSVSEIGRLVGARGLTSVSLLADDSGGHLALRVVFGFDAPDWRDDPQVTAVLTGVARLVDHLEATPTELALTKRGGRVMSGIELTELRHRLLVHRPGDLRAVLEGQNAELLTALGSLRDRESELLRLNDELEQTNRGVVALYAELERRATEIRSAQRAVFVELERALRPLPLLVPGTALDVRYLPAQVNSPTGGDLYDWCVLPDGSLHIAVVDVMGHGVESTRDALRVTHTLRTLVQEDYPLADVLRRADVLLQLPGHALHATSIVARLDPTGRLEVAGAGHPPALLLGGDGSNRYLDAPGRPLGYPEAGSLGTTVVQLGPDDCLLLYTDGLVEARRDIVEGLATLETAAVKASSLALPQLLDTVIAACLQGELHRDDTLLLGVRWHRADARATRDSMGVSLPSTLEAPALARQYLLEKSADMTSAAVDDALVMLSELIGNAVRHGASPVTLRLVVDGARLRADVSDGGAPFDHDATALPSTGPASGRGLFLVNALSKAWGVTRPESGIGKTVWFEV